MADDTLQKLIQGGIKAAQRGDKDLARKAFTQVLKQDPQNEAAWLGIATIASDKKDRLRALKRLLEINPDNEQGREAVRRMGLSPEQVLGVAGTVDPDEDAVPAVNPFTDTDEEPALEPAPYNLEDLGAPPLPATEAEQPSIPDYLSDDLDDDQAADRVDVPDYLSDLDDLAPASSTDSDINIPNYLDDLDDMPFVDDDIEVSPSPFAEADLTADAGTDIDYDALLDDDLGDLSLLDEADELDDLRFTDADDDLSLLDDDLDDLGYEDDLALLDDDFDDDALLEEENLEDYLSSAEILAAANTAPRGQNGTPVPDASLLSSVGDVGSRRVQQYLNEALAQQSQFEWTEKTRGLAGQREYSFFVTRVAIVALIVFGILGAGLVNALLNVESVRNVVFAPTFTPSFTPTFTPTATPGITNTPSPTPDVTLTPSPTFAPSVTPGNPDPNFPPDATDIYLPQGLAQLNEVREAVPLIENREYDEAFELLEQARVGSDPSGNFIPYYWLTVLQLELDDPEQARILVEQGEQVWQERGRTINYGPLVEVSYARVDLYEAEQALAAGNTTQANQLLADAEGHLQQVVNNQVGLERLDQEFVEAWVLLSQRYLLDDEIEQALSTLDEAIANPETDNALFTDIRLRFQRAQIYLAQEDFDRALLELNEILRINPFQEEALEAQVRIALAQDNPGLGVLFAEEYLFYYADSARAFQLLGEARRAENKLDEALDAYARGIENGDENDPAYLDILVSRATIYTNQERYSLAAADLTEALALTDDAPDLRLQRMAAAYFEGDLETAEADATSLLELEDFDQQAPVLLTLARVFVDTASVDADYEDALDFLNQAQRASGTAPEQVPVIAEYRARANLALGDLNDALDQIDDALDAEETGTRYYLRGQILETRGLERDNIADLQAARDVYDFILTWNSIFGYDFADDVRERDAALAERIADLNEPA